MSKIKEQNTLYQAKEITKNVCINMMNSNNVSYKLSKIFMNSKNSKTPTPHRILLNLAEKNKLKQRS